MFVRSFLPKLTMLSDPAWHIQCLSAAIAWSLLDTDILKKRHFYVTMPLRILGLYASMLLCMLLLNCFNGMIQMSFRGLIWELLYGILTLLYCTAVLWKSHVASFTTWGCLYSGTIALISCAGQLSVLTGTLLRSGLLESIVRGLVYLLMVPLALYIRHFNLTHFRHIPLAGQSLILTGSLSLLLLSVAESFSKTNTTSTLVFSLVSYFCLFTVVLVSIYALYILGNDQQQIIILQAEKQRLRGEQETIRMSEQNLKDLKCIRHDLKNQYAYMRILLKEQRYDDLQSFFDKVSQELPVPSHYIDCGNKIVNTILNMEFSKARQFNIQVEHKLIVPPVLPFSENDLCVLLSNMIDNAIDECRHISEQNQIPGNIQLSIYPQKCYLFVMCRNTTRLQQLEYTEHGLKTTKKDPIAHGYGTQIIRRIAERYNGNVDYAIKDGIFTTKVLLDMFEGGDAP